MEKLSEVCRSSFPVPIASGWLRRAKQSLLSPPGQWAHLVQPSEIMPRNGRSEKEFSLVTPFIRIKTSSCCKAPGRLESLVVLRSVRL